MESEKRKREADSEANSRRGKSKEENDGCLKRAAPADEEVDEFFAILKRVQIAIKYFKKRDGREPEAEAAAEAASLAWNPSFKLEDFGGVKKGSDEKQNPGLDLNSDPAPGEKPDNVSDSS